MNKPFLDSSDGGGLDVLVTLPAPVCEKIREAAKERGETFEGRAACERMGGGQPGQYGRVARIVPDRARPAHLHSQAAPHGSAATVGVRPWNGSTPVSTAVSSSSSTSSGGCPGCARAWAWRCR